MTPVNSPRQVLFASLVGTTIEYFDFYIYGTAAVLVFPALFFPATDPATATLASLATFGIAFLARASLAPYIATWLANTYGLQYVGYYLTVAALLSLGGLIATRETREGPYL